MDSSRVNEDQTDVNKAWLEMAESSTAEYSTFEDFKFAYGMSQLVGAMAATRVTRVIKIQRETGQSKEWLQERINDIITGTVHLCESFANKEEESLRKMRDVRDTKERELQVLIKELGEEKFEPPPNLSLIGTARSFYLKCEELRAVKEARMKEWVSLKNSKSQLHIHLGIDGENGEKHDIPYAVPHPEDLLKLRNYVNTLEERKRKQI